METLVNDSKYFEVETSQDDVWRMVIILANVPGIIRDSHTLNNNITYQVKGTFEERKEVYKKVRRLGRGKVRFNIVPKSLECLHGGAWSRHNDAVKRLRDEL